MEIYTLERNITKSDGVNGIFYPQQCDSNNKGRSKPPFSYVVKAMRRQPLQDATPDILMFTHILAGLFASRVKRRI